MTITYDGASMILDHVIEPEIHFYHIEGQDLTCFDETMSIQADFRVVIHGWNLVLSRHIQL